MNGVEGTQTLGIAGAKSGDVSASVSCRVASGDNVGFEIWAVKIGGSCGQDWKPAVCVDNALIRWARAGDSSSYKTTLTPWVWKENSACSVEYSMAVDSPSNRKIYTVAVNQDEYSHVLHHAVVAELTTTEDPKDTTWSSWKFFQYDNDNIQVGNWQIPYGTPSFKTKVEIKSVTGLGCGYYQNSAVKKTFYINQTGNISLDPEDPPRMAGNVINLGYVVNQAGKTVIESQDVSVELKKIVQSMDRNDQFTLNKWEFNPTSNEVMFYVFDVKDESMMNDLQGKQVGNYTIHVIHDSEFEDVRENVSQQLRQLMDNPDYQIAEIGMITDRVNDPPGNYVDLWVYKSTPENNGLDNTVINGWTIRVYPVSG